jgi:peroxiredoxin Q/BCP
MSTLSVGAQAPDFHLVDQTGHSHQLADYQGQWLLLYFYPKDDTPGCTTEACQLRDHWQQLQELGVTVLGVSGDSAASHRKFADKHQLPFALLADQDKELMRAYGVLAEKSIFGKTFLGVKRSSFLIDPAGKIAKVYPAVKPATHAEQVLTDVRALQQV